LKTTFIYALKELAPGEYFSRKIRYIGKANDPYQRFDRHVAAIARKTAEQKYYGSH
jgi:hypothetical protein